MIRRLAVALGLLVAATAAAGDPFYEPLRNYVAPTMPVGTSNSTVATTAFVANALSAANGNLLVGGSQVTGGTSGFVLFNNNGILGQLSPPQLTALCQLFTPGQSGCVPAAGTNPANVLYSNGTWAALPEMPVLFTASTFPSGAIVTQGLVPKPPAPINPNFFLNETGGWTQPNFGGIIGTVAPGQLPLVTTSSAGVVPALSGQITDVFRGDGTWGPTGSLALVLGTGLTGQGTTSSPLAVTNAPPGSTAVSTDLSLSGDGTADHPLSVTALAQKLITTSYAPVQRDGIINMNIPTAGQVISLPDASTWQGQPLEFMDVGPHLTAFPVTLQPAAGQTINGQPNFQMDTDYQYIRLVPSNDGTTPPQWFLH